MRDIRPGCVVHLPAGIYFKPNAGAYVEVRFNDEIRGHPVIIVKRHRTDLVNVVLVGISQNCLARHHTDHGKSAQHSAAEA